MGRKLLISILGVILCFSLAMFAVAPLERVEKSDSSLWMKRIPDARNINELSIPGTHDSGALHSIGDVAGKCQSVTIENQLNLGVRFLDIRLQLKNNELVIVHSFVDQRLSFLKVLDQITRFIKDNPSEFLIISLKEDEEPKNSTKDFSEVLTEVIDDYSEIIMKDTALPKTLGSARGKIYVLSRVSEVDFGYPAYSGWRDSTSFEIGNIFVQDNYRIDDLNVKKNDITECFKKSASLEYSLVINFSSCYIDSGFPPTYAGSSAKVINPWLKNEINNTKGCLGVIVSDFITEDLAEKIYGRNAI